MKILILGDIHGRTIWKDIIDKENPDKVIFLGDYVSTHGLESSEQQINNLKDILSYKEKNPDKVVLLRGNHDIQHLGYYWARCSGWYQKVYEMMLPLKELFLSLTQWIYIENGKVFSHAGISKVWLETIAKLKSIEEINSQEPSEIFGFCPCKLSDYCGDSATQPPTWIRPQALAEYSIEGYTQIVGHTPVININFVGRDDGGTIWLCDALGVKQYLLIEDDSYIVKTYE